MWAWSHHQEGAKGAQDRQGPRRSLERAQPETSSRRPTGTYLPKDVCSVSASPGGGEGCWQVSVLVENLPTAWATGYAGGHHGRWESGRESSFIPSTSAGGPLCSSPEQAAQSGYRDVPCLKEPQI